MQITQKWLARKTELSALFLLIGGLLFRATVGYFCYPTFDEAYYYLYSLHLDWSYFDHPLLVALTTGFGPWVTGVVSQFTIRLGALILHTGSLLLLYLASKRLFSTKAANLTLAIATISPIFQIGFGVLSLPDSPLMFFWSASLYCAINEFFRQPCNQKHSLLQNESCSSDTNYSKEITFSNWENNQIKSPSSPSSHLLTLNQTQYDSYTPSYRLALLGILVGLACLSKYHGFVLGLGLIGFCLTSPRHRCVWRSPWAWVALGLFMITILPILLWNIQHDWVSFRFQSERAVPKNSYNLLNVLVVCLAGVAYLFPTIGLPLWWLSLRSLFNRKLLNLNIKSNTYKLLILWVSLPIILGFTFIGGYRQILPAWSMPGFWGITLLLGQQAVIWQKRSRRRVRRWLIGSGIAVSSILLILLLQVTAGIVQKPGQYALLGGFLPPHDDPSTELIDVEQLRRGFAESPILSAALDNSSFIFTNRYYLGGPIAMSLKPLTDTPITCFDIGRDMRGFAFWSKPEQWLGKDALYITTAAFIHRNDLFASYESHFNSLTEIGTVPIRRGGVVINVIHVYQAKTLLKPYPRSYGI